MSITAEPLAERTPPRTARTPVSASAVLASACEGYAAGTHGTVTGRRDGCVVFHPRDPSAVARWANARESLLVPMALVVLAD